MSKGRFLKLPFRRPKARRRQVVSRPKSSKFVVTGEVVKGQATDFAVGRCDLHLTPNTWIVGQLALGAEVVVRGVCDSEQRHWARNVVVQIGAVRKFILKGRIGPGRVTEFAVNGEDFWHDEETWVFGQLHCGAPATVHGRLGADERRYASKVLMGNFFNPAAPREESE